MYQLIDFLLPLGIFFNAISILHFTSFTTEIFSAHVENAEPDIKLIIYTYLKFC